MTTHRDPEGRPTVFERLPADMGRVISVGRLDLNSEGLLLLTNNGELARRLELPSTGWTRRYRVRVYGAVDEGRLAALAKGAKVGAVAYGPIRATLDSHKGSNAWLTVSLAEGRNREVRRVLEPLGLTVNRLIRLAYGPFQLGRLERGATSPSPQGHRRAGGRGVRALRIIAGTHRGRRLRAPEAGTRPTADRVREAVFNILAHGMAGAVIAEASVLDVFAGSGALGLEALSRGAAHATFMDDDDAAIACVRANVKALGAEADAILLDLDATRPPPPLWPPRRRALWSS